jgi:UDP-2,3-diacylglucosamine pyrophosphatase LpxH
MKILSYVMMVMLICIFTSCKKSSDNPNTTVINPFSNGGSERNMIVVISDIHLGADSAYAECHKNLGQLEKLIQQIRVAPNVKELVIAGDLLDEWFVPATVNTYQGKDQSDFVKRVAATSKGVFDGINQIIQDKNITVTYVPGNHDLGISADNVSLVFPGISQARDAKGLGTYTPSDLPILAIEHGHRYNFACAPDSISNKDLVPGSFLPTGYFFTRIATLHVVQNDSIPGDVLPPVTSDVPNTESQQLAKAYWQSWVALLNMFPVKNKFADKIIVTNINGFTATYSINDILPYQTTPGGLIEMNLYKGVYESKNWEDRQTANKVAVHNSVAQAIRDQDDNGKTDDQANTQYFANPNSKKKIVIFGHTHIAKIVRYPDNTNVNYIYANSGTWIDSNPAATTMNFVVVTPQNSVASSKTYVTLYDIENNAINKLDADSLSHY